MTVVIGVGMAEADRPKRASLRLKRGRRELATLVAAVLVLPERVLMRPVEAREVDDDDEVLLIIDFLREERAGGAGLGNVVRRLAEGRVGRRPVTKPAAISCTVGGGLDDADSAILICAAAVSSAVEVVNDAEGPDFFELFMLNDRLTDDNILSAVLGVDEPLAPSTVREAGELG